MLAANEKRPQLAEVHLTEQTCQLSVIIPIYNEQECLRELHQRLSDVLDPLASSEIVFIDDGSSDDSAEILTQLADDDPRVKVLRFSRNFGHQLAVLAGLEHCRGQRAVIIDADLQDPPELITDMIAKADEGYDVVYAKRRHRSGESWFKRTSAFLFYRVLRGMSQVNIPADTGDFRLIGRPVIDALIACGDQRPFLRGLCSWLGFRQTHILYDRQSRFAGDTHYSLRKMLRLAGDGVVSFSLAPLHAGLWIGLVMFLVGLVMLLIEGVVAPFAHVPGWLWLANVILLLFGLNLMMLGGMAIYLGRVFLQSLRRPRYIVSHRINIAPPTAPPNA